MTSVFSSGAATEHLKLNNSVASTFFPVIFDDSPDLLGPGELGNCDTHDNGLLATVALSGSLLSMSSYGKPELVDAKDFETSRPLQDSMYLAYAQSNFVQPHVASSGHAYPRQTHRGPYATNPLFQPHGQFEDSNLAFSTLRAHQSPRVTSFTPQHGSVGTRIFINIVSAQDLEVAPTLNLYAMFASRQCPLSVTKLDGQGTYRQYILAVDAPAFSTTGWTSSQVPLRLQVQDTSGLDGGLLDVGTFGYTDSSQQITQELPQELTRKRKISLESTDGLRAPAKRTSAQQLRPSNIELYGAHPYLQQPSPGHLHQPTLDIDAAISSAVPSYGRSLSQGGYQQQESPRRVSHHLSTSSASSISQMRNPSPQTPSWSPSSAALHHLSKSPNLTAPSVSRVPSLSSPSGTANPPLIRTSTLQQSPSPGTTPGGASAISAFNPYAMYPHKAVLRIDGDLDSMAEDWTEDEFDVKRRLVQFWRSQSGSTINTTFKPVAPEDLPSHSICISCIWWEAKKECYVTSVDTIYLLESLVAVRFTVEEKNRIRRNLEGFRPMTVSKGKLDSEDFFKLIMGFPNPKPRNIEKDVKVFPWKILAHALKKIIGKYSASYASTASALTTSVSSMYNLPTHSDLGSDLQSTSSHSAVESGYSTGLLSSSRISPHSTAASQDRLAVPYSSAGPGMLQITQPSLASYSYQAQSQSSGSSDLVAMGDAVHRASWDFSSYLSPQASTANSGLYYQPRSAAPDDASSTQYQMTHSSSGP